MALLALLATTGERQRPQRFIRRDARSNPGYIGVVVARHRPPNVRPENAKPALWAVAFLPT
jgi:hypothetical protein